MRSNNIAQKLMKHAQEIGILDTELSHGDWTRVARAAMKKATKALVKASDELMPRKRQTEE